MVDAVKLVFAVLEHPRSSLVLALGMFGYVEAFQITDLTKGVTELQIAQKEERLDRAYAALCMNPGDQGLLERIRELQQEYRGLTNHNYQAPECSLLLKLRS